MTRKGDALVTDWTGDRLKGFREAADLSRRQLMFKIRDIRKDKTPAERTIQRWEDGDTAPGADDLLLLAAVFECQVQDFFAEAA